MAQTLTLTLPDSVISKLQRASALTYRSMDEIVAVAVDTTLTTEQALPGGLDEELA